MRKKAQKKRDKRKSAQDVGYLTRLDLARRGEITPHAGKYSDGRLSSKGQEKKKKEKKKTRNKLQAASRRANVLQVRRVKRRGGKVKVGRGSKRNAA